MYKPNYNYRPEAPITPPPFWLKVRKDYILENFQELLEYMQKYPYRKGTKNPDYDDTLSCMVELSLDFASSLSSQPFHYPPVFEVPTERVVALLAATALCKLKKETSPTEILIPLAALLISAYPDLTQGTQAGLWNLLTGCTAGLWVENIGYSWRDVIGNIKPHILAERLAHTYLRPSSRPEDRFCLENNGLMVVDSTGMVALSTLSLTDYKFKKTRPQFVGGVGLTSRGMAEMKLRATELERVQIFEDALKAGMGFIRSLSEFKPSVALKLKEYSEGDIVPVEVVSKFGIKLVVRSIDPAYRQLQGNVYMRLDPDQRPSIDVIRDCIKIGDILEVVYHKSINCLFDMSTNLETQYREVSCSLANHKMPAIYDSRYKGGDQWISFDGIRVGIPDEKLAALTDDQRDAYDEAIEKGKPIWIQTYKEAPKADGPNFFTYGEPAVDEVEVPDDFKRLDTDETFADDFLGYCDQTYSHLRNIVDPWRPLDRRSADMIARTMAVLADDVSRTSRERLDNLLCAAVACYITGRTSDYEFLHNEIIYLSRLVDFAQGKEIRPLVASDEMTDREALGRRVKMLDELRSYRTPGIDDNGQYEPGGTHDSVDTDLIDRVSKLIEASNSLTGIIRPRELDNIKRTIAATLGVDDEYRSILSNRKWYGDESEQLEFKLSVVFPPLNRRRNNLVADPDGQKWAIIKAVCAFLNSTEGGTLMIGVNDFGFAEGLTNDMQELFRMKYISSPDMDHYKQHIMRFLDVAFREQNGKKTGNDIISGRVRYVPEESPEGKSLLRIQVDPYPHDIVEIQGDIPEGMSRAYVRGSGRSEPLTMAMATDLRIKKGIETA